MDAGARGELEAQARALCDAGDFAGAATLLVRGLGPELFGFLIGVHRDHAVASESFSDLTEALWRGLPRFAWGSSARTWAYAIAGNLALRRRRDAARRARRLANVTPSNLEGVAERVRTDTLSFLRTEKRTRLQLLRDSLSEEDRALLILRVDRGLSWNDLARVLTGTAEDGQLIDAAALAREAARLRKRFQHLKERLREQARRDGIV